MEVFFFCDVYFLKGDSMPNNNVAKVNSHFQNVDIKNSALVQNFVKGDLLYGVEEVRNVFRAILQDKVKDERITIDYYNNTIMIKCLDFDNNFESSLHEKANEEIIDFLRSENVEVDEALQKYVEHSLSHKKFTPKNDNLDEKKLAAVKDEGSYRLQVKLRRLCKAALTSDVKKIHFCLDIIEPKDVINKWIFEDNKRDDRYTTAELRWLYKNWDKIEGLREKSCVLPKRRNSYRALAWCWAKSMGRL